MNDFTVKDSGVRQEWDTGSKRDTQNGKERYDLIGTHGLRRLAAHMAKGAVKYGERNWELGQPTSRSFASAFRHLMQWAAGDTSEDHLAAVAFNVFSIIHVEEGGTNDALRGKYSLMDHPRHNFTHTEQPKTFDIVHQAVIDYQARENPYGGTATQLYKHFNEGSSDAALSRDDFANVLIWLEANSKLLLIQDGKHDPLWQAAAIGIPEEWQETRPMKWDYKLGSDDLCACGARTEECSGNTSICTPDYENDKHASYCRCEKCVDELCTDD